MFIHFNFSLFFGNLFVYYQFQGKDHIDEGTRQLVFAVLLAVAILGVIFLVSLRRVADPAEFNSDDKEETNQNNGSINTAFKNAIKLFFTRDMLLLSLTFMYTGNKKSFILFLLTKIMMAHTIIKIFESNKRMVEYFIIIL